MSAGNEATPLVLRDRKDFAWVCHSWLAVKFIDD